MRADPPAARVMAVVLLEQLVHAGGDRADNGELGKVGAEPGPEPVVGARLIDGARVHLQPVPGNLRADNPEGHARHSGAYQANRDDGTPPHEVLPSGGPSGGGPGLIMVVPPSRGAGGRPGRREGPAGRRAPHPFQPPAPAPPGTTPAA